MSEIIHDGDDFLTPEQLWRMIPPPFELRQRMVLQVEIHPGAIPGHFTAIFEAFGNRIRFQAPAAQVLEPGGVIVHIIDADESAQAVIIHLPGADVYLGANHVVPASLLNPLDKENFN